MKRFFPFFAVWFLAVSSFAQDVWPPYQAADSDFEAVQDGIDSTLKVAESLFPNGIQQLDVVLYDTSHLYIYSRNPDYKLKKKGQWRNYVIYESSHNGKPTESDMARCSGGIDFAYDALYGKIKQEYFTCAPLTSILAIQKKRESIYVTRESYLATVIHEFAHSYMDQELWQMPDLMPMIPRVKALQTNISKMRILQETYAIWCELKASKLLFPVFYQALLKDADLIYSDTTHGWGARVAMELLGEKLPPEKEKKP